MYASFGFLSAAICYGSIIITIAAFTPSAKAKALANRVRSQKVRFLLSQAIIFVLCRGKSNNTLAAQQVTGGSPPGFA